MRILFECFVCDPTKGTEYFYGWRWPTALAESGHEVEVLTSQRSRDNIERALESLPALNIKFHFIDMDLKLYGNKLGMYLAYLKWLDKAASFARTLGPFDVASHITWGNLPLGTRLWKLGYPTVIGPAGGGMIMPKALRAHLEAERSLEALRSSLVSLSNRWAVFPGARIDQCHVLASNEDTVAMARMRGALSVELMTDVLVPDQEILAHRTPRPNRENPVILWVGRFMPRKGLELAIRAFAQAKCSAVLRVVGDGSRMARAKELVHSLGLSERVLLLGSLPRSEIANEMQNADAFLFTSLRDSVGVQNLEAMAAGLPIIGLNCFGAKDLVPRDAGIAVDIESPSQIQHDLATAIERLSNDFQLREQMGAQAHAEALRHRMDGKVKRLESVFDRILSSKSNTRDPIAG